MNLIGIGEHGSLGTRNLSKGELVHTEGDWEPGGRGVEL